MKPHEGPNIFNIPYWKIQIIKFEEKKKELTKLLESYPEDEKNEIQSFVSNRQNDRSGLIKPFTSIMSEEFDVFSKKIKKDFAVHEVWSVSYDKDDYQSVHNHGSIGLTGLLYLDLPKDSPITAYVQPWNDICDNDTQYVMIPIVEGDIVIVPSFVLHFSNPNKSNSKKRIISWDMKILSNTNKTSRQNTEYYS